MYRRNFNRDRPPLIFCADERVPCAFCGCPDLRVGGPRRATYLACPHCGADGPVGESLAEAIRLYKNHPDRGQTFA